MSTADDMPATESIGQLLARLRAERGLDPVKVAQIVLKIAEAQALPPHILLGSDALQYARQAEQARAAEADRWQAVSVSIDMDANGPLPPLPAG